MYLRTQNGVRRCVQENSSRAATDCYNFRVWPIIIGLNSSHGPRVCVCDWRRHVPRDKYVSMCFFFYSPLIYMYIYISIQMSVLFPRDLHFKIHKYINTHIYLPVSLETTVFKFFWISIIGSHRTCIGSSGMSRFGFPIGIHYYYYYLVFRRRKKYENDLSIVFETIHLYPRQPHIAHILQFNM